MKEEVAEKSNVDHCHQKLFLVPDNKFKNPATNHFRSTFNTGAQKTKRREEGKWLVDLCKKKMKSAIGGGRFMQQQKKRLP